MKTTIYYHKNSDEVAFERFEDSNGFSYECTYDDKGNVLTYKNSNGFSYECTYDEQGNELTYKDSNDYFRIKGEEVTEEEFNNFRTKKEMKGTKVTKYYHKNSDIVAYEREELTNGYCYEYTYDDEGSELTFENSDGLYVIKGKRVTKEEFEAFTNNLNRPCVGKKVIVDGVEYELK